MNINSLIATDDFYPGEQRIRVFDQNFVRIPLIYFAIYSPIAALLFFKLGAKTGEAIDFANMLFIFLPVVISLAGKVSAKAWAAYAGFAVFSFAGMAAYALYAMPAALLTLIPASAFLLIFNALAPHVLKEFGLTEKAPLLKELPVMLIIVSVLTFLFYKLTTATDVFKQRTLAPGDYIYYTATCAFLYVPMFGYAYGIMTKRLLSYNFQLMIPILLNTVIFTLFYLPNALCHKASIFMFFGLALCAFGVQIVLGLGYYYARSTRFIFAGYLFFYLMYKAMGV